MTWRVRRGVPIRNTTSLRIRKHRQKCACDSPQRFAGFSGIYKSTRRHKAIAKIPETPRKTWRKLRGLVKLDIHFPGIQRNGAEKLRAPRQTWRYLAIHDSAEVIQNWKYLKTYRYTLPVKNMSNLGGSFLDLLRLVETRQDLSRLGNSRLSAQVASRRYAQDAGSTRETSKAWVTTEIPGHS